MKKHILILYTFFLFHSSDIYSMELYQITKKNIINKYLCEHCGKDCTNLSGLISHKRIHNPEPFICHVCNNKFKFQYNLVEHIKQHEENFKIQTYSCNICDKQYKHQSTLLQHQKRHFSLPSKLYTCKICNKISIQKICCKQPIKRHEENLKIQTLLCDICGKQCKSRSGLSQHKKIHFSSQEKLCTTQIYSENFTNLEDFFGPQDILDQFNINNLKINDPLLCFNTR